MIWLYPILLPLAAAALSIIGLLIFRRRVHHSALVGHNDTAGAVFSIVGTLLTVLLAFVVVIVWEAMGTADERAALEAGVLGDVMRDAGLFSEPVRSELQNEFREYARAVIEEEWPAMATGESSPHVWQIIDRIFKTFSKIQPVTAAEINIHAEMLTGINELSDHRRLRLLSADNKVPELMWYILVIAGIVTVFFSYMLGVESTRSHLLMTGTLTMMIALTMYMIHAIDHPYGGAVSVEPTAFRLVLEKIKP
jgi:hypothetical protein